MHVYALALLSGLLLFLASPIVGYWGLISIALVPFFVGYFYVNSWRFQVVSILLMALPFCLAQGEPLFRLAGTWWVSSESNLERLNFYYICGIALIVIFAAACYIVAFWGEKKLFRILPRPISLGLSIALIEYLRSSIFLAGYSWGSLGYLLIDTVYVKHFAAYVGVYGLTFFFVAYSAWAAQIIVRFVNEKGNLHSRINAVFFKGQNIFETTILSSLLFFVLLYGASRELNPPYLGLDLRVAVIASQISTNESIEEKSYYVYRGLFLDALSSSPDLILTPENIFPYFILDEETARLSDNQSVYLAGANELYQDFLSLTRTHASTTFAVALHTKRSGELYNSIVLYQNGSIMSMYKKREPVLFTEYVPSWLDMPLFQRFARGEDVQDFRLGDELLGGYICSEIGVTPLSVHGAKIILSPSNDSALVSKTIAPLQHQFARMRALESGAYILRASRGGITSVINPHGRALGELFEKEGVLVVDIQ